MPASSGDTRGTTAAGRGWKVYKFGGTSVARASCFRQCADIVLQAASGAQKGCTDRGDEQMAVVVSAMGGKPKVTDLLLRMVTSAEQQNQVEYERVCKLLIEKHVKAIHEMLPESKWAALENEISSGVQLLKEVLRAVYLTKYSDIRTRELVAGFGEVWSAQVS